MWAGCYETRGSRSERNERLPGPGAGADGGKLRPFPVADRRAGDGWNGLGGRLQAHVHSRVDGPALSVGEASRRRLPRQPVKADRYACSTRLSEARAAGPADSILRAMRDPIPHLDRVSGAAYVRSKSARRQGAAGVQPEPEPTGDQPARPCRESTGAPAASGRLQPKRARGHPPPSTPGQDPSYRDRRAIPRARRAGSQRWSPDRASAYPPPRTAIASSGGNTGSPAST